MPPVTSTPPVFLYVQVKILQQVHPLLVPRMLTQIPVMDRTFLLRKYPNCFTGSDAVQFFIRNRFATSEHEALCIGNALLKAGLFRHVKNQYLFRNGLYFYRFAAHEDYAKDHDKVALRSSRMMSVACNSFLGMPEIRAINTENNLGETGYSDLTWKSTEDDTVATGFDEADVVVETGIRVGGKTWPGLVGELVSAKDLVGTHSVAGKILEKSFTGRAAVKWLVRRRYVRSVEEGVGVGRAMLKAGVFYPVEDTSDGFECDMTYYRMVADTDISKELKKGARKDGLLKLFGIDRGKIGKGKQSAGVESPWFEEFPDLSFTSDSGR